MSSARSSSWGARWGPYKYLINIATLHFFRYKHFTQHVTTDNNNTLSQHFRFSSGLMSQFFPDTQFFVYPIHQTFNNKIFESYSNLYSELFRLENTEFHFNCLFILTIICWKYVLDNICNKAVKYRRGKDILQGQEQWQEWCSCLVKLILLFISATWIRYCSVVDEGWIMERFALRQLLIIQHFDFRQTRGGQWAHAAGQPTLNTE